MSEYKTYFLNRPIEYVYCFLDFLDIKNIIMRIRNKSHNWIILTCEYKIKNRMQKYKL